MSDCDLECLSLLRWKNEHHVAVGAKPFVIL